MYESPIELLVTEIQHQIVKQQDKEIYKAVLNYVPNVDKEELIRALQYDRDQYEKGYADGKRDAMAEYEWISVKDRLPEDGVRVLVAHDDGIVRLGISKGGFPAVLSKSRLNQPFPFADVTHWMPIPQPPKGE